MAAGWLSGWQNDDAMLIYSGYANARSQGLYLFYLLVVCLRICARAILRVCSVCVDMEIIMNAQTTDATTMLMTTMT